jgi:hypothetical protein
LNFRYPSATKQQTSNSAILGMKTACFATDSEMNTEKGKFTSIKKEVAEAK